MDSGMLTRDELTAAVNTGEIDTVVVGVPDMVGRLVGKRVTARMYLDEVIDHGTRCGASILAADADMTVGPGFAIANAERGFGDLDLRPIPTTLRRLPWQPGTALVLADTLALQDGAAIAVAPRTILATQIARLADRGLNAQVGSELEFLTFDENYRQAFAQGYRGLTPSTDSSANYSVLTRANTEPLLRALRRGMDGAGMYCESIKAETSPGQQEIAFRYADAMSTCDNHVIYTHGAKEIADQYGQSLTFMAKFDTHRGNSCHIHLSLRDGEGRAVFADAEEPQVMSPVFEHFLAGIIASMRELTLCYAPTINSYKRFVDGSLAPTKVAWGWDNRTCALRIVGTGDALRLECRVPGGDVNPYLAVAALIAGGVHGLDHHLALPPVTQGNGYHADAPGLPNSLSEAVELFADSSVAKEAFGADVVAHYENFGRNEAASYAAAITDWERGRSFE